MCFTSGVSLLEASKSLAFLSSSYSKEVWEDLDGTSVNEVMGGIRRKMEECFFCLVCMPAAHMPALI
jgi:hypothetical protein